MAFHLFQHFNDGAFGFLTDSFIAGVRDDAVLGCRAGDVPLAAKGRRHGPSLGLHHDFWNIPERLHLHHLAIHKAEELVKAHVDDVPGRWNIQPWTQRNPQIIASTADPIVAVIVGAGHHDMVPTL